MAEDIPTVSLTTWNTNYDHRASPSVSCAWTAFDWPARRESVIQNILRFGTDFVCLQELRDQAVHDIMGDARLAVEYDMAYGRTNGTDMALCLLTMWKKKLWECSGTSIRWFGEYDLSNTWTACPGGNGYGRIILISEFNSATHPSPKSAPVLLAPGPHIVAPKGLIVMNVHCGMGKDERIRQAHMLHRYVKDCIESRHEKTRIIACGDFNSFEDAYGLGQLVLTGIPEARFLPVVRHGNPIKTLVDGTDVLGTQLSYPYDTYVKYKGSDHEEIHPLQGEMGGLLDNVFFTKCGMDLRECRLLTWKTDGTVAQRDDLGFRKEDMTPRFPSDHFPMRVIFTAVKETIASLQ